MSPIIDQLTFAPRNRHDLSRMVKQQFWLFGFDVRRPAGNLLVQMGFDRSPAPDDSRFRSSRYHKILSDGTVITLWSFGLCWSTVSRGSIYLARLEYLPEYSPHSAISPQVWDPELIEGFSIARTADEKRIAADLLLEVVNWFAEYEQNVLDTCGLPYRDAALHAWRDPLCQSEEMVNIWSMAHGVIQRLPLLDEEAGC